MTMMSSKVSESRRPMKSESQRFQSSWRSISHHVARKVATSCVFSTITTVLTIYALFGDDMRLGCTAKTADLVFDCITIISMSIFSLEIVVFTIGRSGYVFGFFFWLDLLSTLTLLLDITTIAEDLFGDSISNLSTDNSGGSRGSGGSNSAEAGRAARVSRAGTKAGRVVRLIRLVRLVRLLKIAKKSTAYKGEGDGAAPGLDVDDDDPHEIEKESAVSKKLSEMTTRRVIVLVLVIMLALPFFQPTMWKDKMPTSAEYGINVLYRRFKDDMLKYQPWSNASAREVYLQSRQRRVYVDNFYAYIYYHNPFCDDLGDDDVPAENSSPQDNLAELFWVGAGGEWKQAPEFFLPGAQNVAQLNTRWNGQDWYYHQCNLTSNAVAMLGRPWNATDSCLSNIVRGVSLTKSGSNPMMCPEELRYQERCVVYPTQVTDQEWDDLFFVFVFDKRRGSQMEAWLNTTQTLFICFLLGFGAMTFTRDANKLVLTPIERMITKLNRIRNNPLEAMAIGDEEHHKEQVTANRNNRTAIRNDDNDIRILVANHSQSSNARMKVRKWLQQVKSMLPLNGKSQKEPEPMETVVLEKTIIKIGSLLALGFGEAGAEIIGQNMKGGDSSALNAMIPGRRVDAIFGFCDIRNFTDATEVLQDQVMVFVNRIAGVVHSCINDYFGSPNKNIGDAFLLAWRLSGHPSGKQQRLADMALVSFIKVIAHINKSPLLAEYRNHPKLVKRLPNYRVRMGFGLHSGWAIEGAIGSEFKIDASYLSPNVNMAARLEAVTKQFGCLILLSESLHKLMSEEVAHECRLIDHVKMVGTKGAFKLYTIDLDDLALEVDRSIAATVQTSKAAQYKQRLDRQKKRNERWSDTFKMHGLFQEDLDIQTMRNKFTVEFNCRFNMAYLNYEAGEWRVAKDMLEATRFLLATEDGPSAALLRYMRQYDWEAPPSWPSYRVLAEK
eukprot:CAMPEP_0177246774 /NCGR_PEP_ID=MMETSP0367-20130122/51196_1 /TAXON_ID=447022 ORGANISM="Scrippsiella hangoei-like, Strain SHHI-4" /NCGR_SAMPLE_ID=MMETSP0367 /ASSEMBLY_ACC=CAM_ASM_000362 /LENGTH=948 /DNA_ID=CAMNT_0018698831 /DNA_START=55 /DNA_END=2901 /DNA_ORIENTATION=-